MTRGREGNFLYIAEPQPGDTETGHGQIRQVTRRESADYARDLLVSAGVRAKVTAHLKHYLGRPNRTGDWPNWSVYGLPRLTRY